MFESVHIRIFKLSLTVQRILTAIFIRFTYPRCRCLSPRLSPAAPCSQHRPSLQPERVRACRLCARRPNSSLIRIAYPSIRHVRGR